MKTQKLDRLRPKRHSKPLIGKDIFVDFENLKENPFTSRDGDMLIVAVCGAVQIRASKCVPSYNAETRTATIMFHFTRPKWAEKALRRLVAMQALFAGSKLRTADVAPMNTIESVLDAAMAASV